MAEEPGERSGLLSIHYDQPERGQKHRTKSKQASSVRDAAVKEHE